MDDTIFGARVSNSLLAQFVMDFNWRQPFFIWGPPGCGKSQGVYAGAKGLSSVLDREVKVYDWRLALSDPTDIKGIPAQSEDDRCIWLVPEELPDEGPAILFLDEFPHARPAVQAACYSLIHDRRVANYRLPDEVWVLAAGNRLGIDGGTTFRMDAPLSNRFTHFTLLPDFAEWKSWALQNNIHHTVMSFLTMKPNLLYQMSTSSPAFPTPRVWAERVSRAVTDKEEGVRYLAPGMLDSYVVGTVGESAGLEFCTFMKMQDEMPDIEEILAGKDIDVPARPDMKFLVCGAIVASLREKATKKRVGAFFSYMRKMPKEFGVRTVVEALKSDVKLGLNRPVYDEWLRENKEVLV